MFPERFKNEASALARLSHPAIVNVHDAGEASGLRYFVMEYVEGRDLAHGIAARGRLPQAEVRSIALQVCGARLSFRPGSRSSTRSASTKQRFRPSVSSGPQP